MSQPNIAESRLVLFQIVCFSLFIGRLSNWEAMGAWHRQKLRIGGPEAKGKLIELIFKTATGFVILVGIA